MNTQNGQTSLSLLFTSKTHEGIELPVSRWKCQHSSQSERGSAFPLILHHHEEAQLPGRWGPPTALVTLWNTARPGLGLNLLFIQWVSNLKAMRNLFHDPCWSEGMFDKCTHAMGRFKQNKRESVQLWFAEPDLTPLRWMCYNTFIVDELLTGEVWPFHFWCFRKLNWCRCRITNDYRGSCFCSDTVSGDQDKLLSPSSGHVFSLRLLPAVLVTTRASFRLIGLVNSAQ